MCVTWCLLLLFGFTACKEELISNVTMIPRWDVESICLKYSEPILFDNEPFKIFVETSKFYDGDVLSIECRYNKNNKLIINQTLIYVNNRYFAKVNKANLRMADPWTCVIMRKSSDTLKYLNTTFSAHIRFREIPGEMRVNDRDVSLSVTDLTITDYDAVGTYYYLYGELAKITCRKTSKYNLQELLLNMSDTRHTTKSDKEVKMYLKLGHKRSPDHIDCAMTKLFNLRDTVNIRLIFKPFTGQIDYPQFEVNGLTLSPSINDSVSDYVFVYEYYPGEDLIITSKLDPKRFPSLTCVGINLPDNMVLNPDDIPALRLNIPTNELKRPNVWLDCLVKQRFNFSIQISLKLIEDSMKFSPSITGIQWSNIIAKFDDNINIKVKEGTFYVSQNGKDNMTTLHCNYSTTGSKWYYDEKVNSELLTTTPNENEYNSSTKQYVSSRTFQLPKNLSQTTLKCRHGTETSKVILIQEKEPNKLNTQVTFPKNVETSDGIDTGTNTGYSESNMEDDRGLFSGKIFLPIIIAVITIFIIIIMITLVACICNRKKLPKIDTDINYENLPAHNEGTMPTPSQWDPSRLKKENIEDSYAKVIPKSQRTKLSEMYAEPISNETACYATPYNADSESPYAEVIPKSQRNENVLNEPEDIGDYSYISPKIDKNQMLPINNVENGTKLRNRADSDKHMYCNVLNSELYANVSSSGR